LDKAPDAFRTISEVADDLDVPQHVLRFWESRFPQIRPMKRAGGRRYYRPDDVLLLRGISHLLYGEGYTIRGVQRILREQGPKFVQAVWQPGAAQPAAEREDAAPEQPLAPDEAARTMFGLLKSPERAEPVADADPDADETVEQRDPAEAASRSEQPSDRPAEAISPDDARRLKAALHELSECRRLLEQALRAEAA
jgi:DNA-binding transcriptional MerR regulator